MLRTVAPPPGGSLRIEKDFDKCRPPGPAVRVAPGQRHGRDHPGLRQVSCSIAVVACSRLVGGGWPKILRAALARRSALAVRNAAFSAVSVVLMRSSQSIRAGRR